MGWPPETRDRSRSRSSSSGSVASGGSGGRVGAAVPPLVELCLDVIAQHIHSFASLAYLPEELAQKLVERLVAEKGISHSLLRFLFAGLDLQISELDLSICAEDVRDPWLTAISKQSLMSSLNLSGCRLLTQAGLRAISTLPQLVRLDLSYCTWVSTVAIKHVVAIRSLEELILRGCRQLCDRTVELLVALKRLRVLNLADCPLLTARLPYILVPLAGTLERLCLDHLVPVDDAGLAHLLSHCGRLKRLGLAYTAVTARTVHHIRQHVPQLERLSLGGCAAVPDAAVASVLPHLHSLLDLDLSRLALSTGTLDALLTRRALLRLDLSGCESLTDDMLRRLCAGLPALQVLRLSACVRLSDAAAAALAASGLFLQGLDLSSTPLLTDAAMLSLRTQRTLTCLDLSDHEDISAHALMAVARLQALEVRCARAHGDADLWVRGRCPGGVRQELSLRWCRVSDETLSELARLPRLRRLDLRGCRFITTACVPVLAAMPALMELDLRATALPANAAALITGVPRVLVDHTVSRSG